MELSAGPDAGETETIQISNLQYKYNYNTKIQIAAILLFFKKIISYISVNTLYNPVHCVV